MEDVTQELLVTLTDAATLVEHLAGALGDAGLHDATHPELFQLVTLLRGLLSEHAVSEERQSALGDIADRVRYKRDLSEE
jgi:hypothetical protein